MKSEEKEEGRKDNRGKEVVGIEVKTDCKGVI